MRYSAAIDLRSDGSSGLGGRVPGLHCSIFSSVKLVVSRNMSEGRGGGTLDCRSSIVSLSDSNAEELNGLALEAGPTSRMAHSQASRRRFIKSLSRTALVLGFADILRIAEPAVAMAFAPPQLP